MSSIPPTPGTTAAAPDVQVAKTANQSKLDTSQNPKSAQGTADEVTLSAPAQAVLAGQNSNKTASKPSSSSDAKAAPVTLPSSSTANTAALIQAAKQKVIPQVGVSGASEVVDNKGNISKAKLAEVIAEQAQKN